jgi:hypothetical protein
MHRVAQTFPQPRKFPIAIIYLLIALGLTLSLLVVGNSALVGGDYSGGLGIWTTWWPAQAFASNQNPAFSDYLLYPIQTNLFPLLSLPLSAIYFLLARVITPFISYHLLLTICLWLNAVSGYAFLRRPNTAGIDQAAFYGGLLIAFNPISWLLAGQGMFAPIAVFPLLCALIRWRRFVNQPTFRNVIWLVASLYLTIITSIEFWNLLITFWLVYAIWTLPKDKTPLVDSLLLGGLILLGAFAFYPASNMLWSTYVPIFGSLEVWQGLTPINSLIWIGLGLFGIGLRRLALRMDAFPLWRLWAAVIVLHLVLYVAPHLAPLSLLSIPNLTNLTQPAIFLLPVSIALAALFTEGIRYWQTQKPPHRFQVILPAAVIILISMWWLPLPRTALPDAALYAPLADDPENYTIIDFPIGVDSLANRSHLDVENAAYPTFGIPYRAGLTLAYAPWHHKRVVGGLVNTLSDADLETYRRSTLAQLVAFSDLPTDPIPTAKILREQLASWRVGYIVIHPEDAEPLSLRKWLVWTGTFCEVDDINGAQLWRARWHPKGCPDYQIDVGSPEDELALGEGWYAPEQWPDRTIRWAGSTQIALVRLWGKPSTDYTLRIQAAAPSISDQTVEVWSKGEKLGAFSPTENWVEYTIPLSNSAFEPDGFINLELRHSSVALIDGRDLAAAYDRILLSPTESQ